MGLPPAWQVLIPWPLASGLLRGSVESVTMRGRGCDFLTMRCRGCDFLTMRGRGCDFLTMRGRAESVLFRQVTAPVTSEASGDGCSPSTSARLARRGAAAADLAVRLPAVAIVNRFVGFIGSYADLRHG